MTVSQTFDDKLTRIGFTAEGVIMELFKNWAPANELATAVEARQSGTLKFLEAHFYDSHNWLLYQDSLGKHLGWTLEETIDHVFMKIRKAEVVRLRIEALGESGA